MIEIQRLTEENKQDIFLKNEPFSMPGRMIPALDHGKWRYTIEYFDEPQSMTFPDEPYDFEELDRNGVIFGAYDDGKCVGLAIYQLPFFKYLYLYDLKVCNGYKGHGIGRKLIEAGLEWAKANGYCGIYTQGQDNNLNACRFYLKTGFEIGGFDNHVYNGTAQEGKADIIFYTHL